MNTPTVALQSIAAFIRDVNPATNTILLSFLNGPYNTVAAGSNTMQVQLSLSSVLVVMDMIGKFIFFPLNTPTAALRGVSVQIQSINQPVNQVILNGTLPASPTDSDFAFITSSGTLSNSDLVPLPAIPTDNDFVMIFDAEAPAELDGQVDDPIVTGPLVGSTGTTQDVLVVDGQRLSLDMSGTVIAGLYDNLQGKLVRFADDCPTVALRGFVSVIALAVGPSAAIVGTTRLVLLTRLPAVPTNLDTFNVVAELIRETPVLEILLG